MDTSPWTILIIGMGTVFAALIVLSLGLTLFSKMVKNKKQGNHGNSGSSPIPSPASSGSGIDSKIVAAIVAAIAAASGKPVSSFRIAAVERTGISTPVWGHIDRMARSPRGR